MNLFYFNILKCKNCLFDCLDVIVFKFSKHDIL